MSMTLDAAEELLLKLLGGKFSSLHITVNDENAPNYMTVAEWDDQPDPPFAFGWINEDERQNFSMASR